jgi:hypothetical protein
MPAKLGATHWQARADEARLLAQQMNDNDSRSRMLRIAADYEILAHRSIVNAERQQPPPPQRQPQNSN